MQQKPILKIKYSYEELINCIECNDIDKMKDILNETNILHKRKNEDNDLLKVAIKFNNLYAVNFILDFLESESCYYRNNNSQIIPQTSLSSLLFYIIENSDSDVFIYFMQRFKLDFRTIDSVIIKAVFDKENLTKLQQHVLTSTDLRYKINSKYALSIENSETLSSLRNNNIYFNCTDLDLSDNSDDFDQKNNILDLNQFINKDKYKRLVFIRTWKYFLIKYKSAYGVNFTLQQQRKIIKYM